MLQLNVHQQSVLFENLTSLPVGSTFIQTRDALALTLDSINKQKNKKRHSKLLFFSAVTTNSFILLLSSVSIILSIPCIQKF